ncbi:E3 ubiquitin-protein ligase TRAIP-like isoform X2 [Mercenaria mercenaria]|nr:E3 ubiquitin-protein ligase TRAIP-like isoform X2 [Mercenaria mercenaria]
MAEAQCSSQSQSRTERRDSTVENMFKCPICHNEMSRVSITHCGHRFCNRCIRKWIEQHPNCPTCRTKITAKNLIEDRTFDEFIRTFKERTVPTAESEAQQEQAGRSGGMSIEELGNILQSVMPQRDQDMRNLTDNLIRMKDQEIARLTTQIQEHTSTISRLNGELRTVQDQLGDELPILTERSAQLQLTSDRQREQNQQLQDKTQSLETSLTSYKVAVKQTMEQKKLLEEQHRQKTQELQTTKTQLDVSKKENTQLKLQLQSTKDALNSQKEQLEKSESTTEQMKELVNTFFQQKQMLDAELETARQECLQLGQQVQQLQMFESMYQDTAQQLKDLNETVLPKKDSTIIQLQERTTELINDVAILRQNNIPLGQHVQILQSNLQEAIQQLQCYYEQEYGSKIMKVEKVNEVLKNQLNEKETELQNREDVGDELKSATRTYKKLIKENCDLKDKVKEQDNQIRHLRQDVAHSKQRTNQLEQMMNSRVNV